MTHAALQRSLDCQVANGQGWEQTRGLIEAGQLDDGLSVK
jgi:hypothetical protein